MSSSNEVVVDGVIVVDGQIASFAAAKVYVYIEDVGLLDASAVILGKQLIDVVSHRKGTVTEIPFRVTFIAPNLSTDCSIRVHVALTGSEEIKTGDLVSTQSYLVLATPNEKSVRVTVQKVR